MGSALNIGKLFGIQLRLHYSWFIIFVFFTILLVSPHWLSPSWWIIGIITCLLFFASVVAHELAHSLVGRANGIPIKSITLFIFGGVAQMTKEATRPGAEFKMAAAGPACSLAIGGLFFGLFWLFPPDIAEPIATMVYWLAYINVALAIFNLIPGFPLDGGRVLRSFLWQVTGDYQRSTRIATQVGRGVGYLFILGGILIAFLRPFGLDWFSGLWLVFIGWFLENAASASYRQAKWREALFKFTASQVMTSNCPVVPSSATVNQLVQGYIFTGGHHLFLVADEGKLEGILTLQNITSVSNQNRDVTQVKEIMTPINKLKAVRPDQDALSILEQMDENDMNQMPVVSEGRVIGLIARDNLLRFLRIRSVLGI
ncbi:MAG TPA: CBS domain-containing protein [Dehalococcoidia bacterium]|nr:CBS domain-containing protein [Dehalococcoidia bacterium]